MNYALRQRKLMGVLSEERCDAMVVTHPANIAYLCGFTGSAGVLVAQLPRWILYTDGRYTEQARQQVKGPRVSIVKGAPLAAAGLSLGKSAAAVRIAIEADHLTVAGRAALGGQLPKRVRLRATSGLVESLRMIKEPEEIERIRAAVLAGSALLDRAIAVIRPGASEISVAAELEYAARQAGADGMSFDTIVAAGARSALPHGRASQEPIPGNGFVVMDFGVILGGYCSDMTRTVHVGPPGAEMCAVYDAVLEAQLAGLDAICAGVEVGKVDQAARQVLRRAGLARFFTHSTGHGVGLEIHEPPRLARGGADILQAGMVVTVEPGVYIPGKGGVRIEDMAVVGEQGAEILTPSSKNLITV